ncbi:MAG: peptidoglycan-binding protein [Cyanomargarita calcarea GSE-NOS-MK-12-04C]|jgi:peptidoglycan hydrolase-like protein with peptidoglycan-binding domain|uniref:Peptidoglycan-binding protein n=1 Tax=Cyanomargarita calcarea GSE-NOS-MK-12-04C TaxID=2839659 RepID=A0A951UUM6_9CYAN|nr:peptidoglycan-binding protein [Cyanomargarita calcarea GSE-NOS-MK-12-04C]
MYTQAKVILLIALTFGVVNIPGQALAAPTSSSVRNTQRCLQRLGYFKGPVTGYLGPLTKNAITRFQQANGLPAIGSVGPRTQQLLQSKCRQGRIPSPPPNPRRPPVIPGGNYSSGDLRVGSTGISVENLQRNLQSLGYYSNRITGYFGPITRQAVIRFQQAIQLPVTGVADFRTLQEINFRLDGRGGVVDRATISIGARGESVRQLQEALQKLGFFSKNEQADGNFDEYTKRAVSDFQLSVGLPSNGIVDQRTWQRLGIRESRDDRSYVVVIPLDKDETFYKVQSYLSQAGLNNQAVVRDSRLGRYIEAGKYRDLDSAEKLSKWLRERSFDARVVKTGRF